MATQRSGSAKKILHHHNVLLLQGSKNQTVKDQLDDRQMAHSGECHLLCVKFFHNTPGGLEIDV